MFDSSTLQALTNWLAAHPHWGGIATFLISISESLAFVGLLIPGTVVMTIIGGFIGAGVLPAVQTTLWAIAGAIVGDGLSYWLGYHYKNHIRDIWPFRRFPNILQSGEKFFARHGGKSIFLGRFVGPVRPMIPVIAGMMNMPPAQFTFANVGSAIAWAVVYMAPGMMLGALSQQLSPQIATRIFMIVLGTFALIWLFGWIIRRLWQFLCKKSHHYCQIIWQKISEHRVPILATFLRDPVAVDSPHLLQSALLGILCLVLWSLFQWGWLHISLTESAHLVHPLMASLHVRIFTTIATAWLYLGNPWVTGAFVSMLCVGLCLQKRWLSASYFLLQAITVSIFATGIYGWSSPHIHTSSALWMINISVFSSILWLLPYHRSDSRHIGGKLVSTYIFLLLIAHLYFNTMSFMILISALFLGLAHAQLYSLLYQRYALNYRETPPARSIWIAVLCSAVVWGYLFFHLSLKGT